MPKALSVVTTALAKLSWIKRFVSPVAFSRAWPVQLIAALIFCVLPSNGAAASSDMESTTFSTRSGPRGATMFARLSPEQTGIVSENNYADPKMWTDHYQELIYGGIGTGIAIGDYDGDGRPDIFVVSKTEQSRLFRNLGNWKFEEVTEKAGLDLTGKGVSGAIKGWLGGGGSTAELEAWKQGATFVDVNNDGRLDLYVCRFGAPNLLFINKGDGTFSEEAQARGLAVVDGCGMAAFYDYDRDGWLDVYVQTNMLNAATHPNGRRDYLFHNNGDGTFRDVTERAGIAGETAGHSATWWDYDGDGWPDLYVANDFAAPDRLYRNNKDGTFTDVINEVVPHLPYYSMGSDLGDVNNDGLPDLFVADMAPTSHEKDQRGMAGSRVRAQLAPPDARTAPQYMRNALFVNTGTGRMLEAAFMAGVQASDWTWSVRFEDLDNDGWLDLHITNGMAREYHNAEMLDKIMAGENPADSRSVIRASPVLAESHLAFRNRGDLHFEDVSAAWGLDERGVSFGAAFGDLDGDGDLDLVYANYQKGVSVLRNDSDSGHRLIVALQGTRSNRFGVGATVEIKTAAGIQTRTLVPARGYLSSSEPVLHFGLGEQTSVEHMRITWPSGVVQNFENVGADQRITITETAGDSSPALPQIPPAPTGGMFEPFQKIDRAAELSDSVRVEADFDHTGKGGAFVAGAVLPGKAPLAAPNRLLVQREGAWVDVTEKWAPSLNAAGWVQAAMWTDVDGDGWLDLLLAVQWGTIKYFHNQSGHALEDWSERAGFAAAGEGWWDALAAGDFNGDGKLDYLAGNLGLNTRYQASPDHPTRVYFGDFGGSAPFAIEAQEERGKLFPWMTRNELSTKLPAIMRRFPSNDRFAKASLAEIVGEERLKKARSFQATELRSGLFLSQADGTYLFKPLPRVAQIAPIRCLAISDFDGDGALDVFAGQNLFSPPASVGRFDGGLGVLLRGNGKGDLEIVPWSETKLVVPGEARAVEATDLNADGWPDVIVTRGDRSTLGFVNRGARNRVSLRVVLTGETSGSNVIGAVVIARRKSGGMQMQQLPVETNGVFFGATADDPVVQVTVRSPSGGVTEHEVVAGTKILNLSVR